MKRRTDMRMVRPETQTTMVNNSNCKLFLHVQDRSSNINNVVNEIDDNQIRDRPMDEETNVDSNSRSNVFDRLVLSRADDPNFASTTNPK